MLHGAEALHGDIGRITQGDVVVALSNSGEDFELLQMAKALKATSSRLEEKENDNFFGFKFLLLTGNLRSSLARYADAILSIGEMTEACAFNVVPTNTTTAMLALGDALALCLFELLNGRRCPVTTFARFHPGGTLGKSLTRVQQVMSPCGKFIQTTDTVRDIIVTLESNSVRTRSTVAVVVDTGYKFVGLFKDRDLRQILRRCPNSTTLHPTAGSTYRSKYSCPR